MVVEGYQGNKAFEKIRFDGDIFGLFGDGHAEYLLLAPKPNKERRWNSIISGGQGKAPKANPGTDLGSFGWEAGWPEIANVN